MSMLKAILVSLGLLLTALPGVAAPVPYALDLKASKVAFYYNLDGRQTRGAFPVLRAATMVDLQDVRRSSLDVTISTGRVQAGDPVASLALRGADLLATGQHPTARFVSTRVAPHADGVRVTGELTLKGVTQLVTLDAVFQRRADAPEDNSELILQVTGEISRSAFGVSGYPKLVADEIVLNFQVHLKRE